MFYKTLLIILISLIVAINIIIFVLMQEVAYKYDDMRNKVQKVYKALELDYVIERRK
jgi:hypothetical protein